MSIHCVANEVYIHVLVFNPDGIVLVRRILYYLSGLVVLEPSRTGINLDGKMLDLRIGIELWSTLESPVARDVRASWPVSLPWTVNRDRCICGMLTVDM